MADNGRLTVDQKVKVVLFYAETKCVVATQRRFRARFGTRRAPCKQIIYRLSLGTICQPMRINSVPDVKCFCKNTNALYVNQWYDFSCATLYIIFLWLDSLRPPHYRGFTITLGHATLSSIPLDERSARRMELYITKHITHKEQITMLAPGLEPAISENERLQAHALDRAATLTYILSTALFD